MTEREIATKILRAMDLINKSWNKQSEAYDRSYLSCFQEVFENSMLSNLYYLAVISCWNETEKWCNDVLKCEALKY